jgi:hypothetical protein
MEEVMGKEVNLDLRIRACNSKTNKFPSVFSTGGNILVLTILANFPYFGEKN